MQITSYVDGFDKTPTICVGSLGISWLFMLLPDYKSGILIISNHP